jgi:surface carbohydrate biosynthesis protein (TIGR04326 family)
MLVAQDYIASYDGDFLVICESDALCQDLAKMLNDMPVCVEIINKHLVRQIFHVPARAIRTAMHKFYFFVNYSARCLFARMFTFKSRNKRKNSISRKQKSIGLLSWVDDRSFSSEGAYMDVYFGTLRHILQPVCRNLYPIVDVLPTASYRTILRRLSSQNEPFFLVEEFITPVDVLRAIVHVSRLRPHQKSIQSSMGLPLENIITTEFNHDRQGIRAEQSLLYYYAAARISQKSDFKTFFYPFENHTWEKMFVAGFRSQTPRTRLIGYAHTIVNPLYTCYAISHKERKTIPLPDIIMVNGERAKKGLESSGFPAGSTIISGALRYPHLPRGSQKQLPRTKTVLVVASAGINHTLEIVYKAFHAFSDHPDLNIIIKCHPTTPYDLVRNQLPEFPSHITIADKKIEELFLVADVVVYTESAACIEALARGIPVVHVLSDYSFDMNVLEGVDFVRSAGTPGELYEAVASELINGAISQEQVIHVVNEIFAPVDEGIISSVLMRVMEE